MVTSNSTVGKIAKSSGRLTLNTAMTMTSDSAMLNVNNTSSTTGGSGRIIIARIEMRPSGMPMPSRISDPSPAIVSGSVSHDGSVE